MLKDLAELRRLQAILRQSISSLENLADQRLRALVRYCYDQVPFYRTLFDEAGVDLSRIRSVADLERLPITSKQDLREAGEDRLLSRDVNVEDCYHDFTSGSTGEPFKVYFSPQDVRRRRMVQLRSVLAVGMHPMDRLAVLGPVHWRRPGRVHRLGLYRRENLQPLAHIEDQLDHLRRFRPTILWAYPGTLHALLDRIDFRLEEFCRPRMLITSAETPDRLIRVAGDHLPDQRFNFYGTLEAGRIAWECPAHEGLHVNIDQVWLEILPTREASAEEGLGEVVVTTLNNRANPFLRYRLGDLARWIDGSCSCGSPLPMIAPPRGRLYRPLRLPSGATRSTLEFMFILREQPWVMRYRAIQKSREELEIEVITHTEPNDSELAHLRSRLEAYVAEPMQVSIRRVATIDNRHHKFETFVSHL